MIIGAYPSTFWDYSVCFTVVIFSDFQRHLTWFKLSQGTISCHGTTHNNCCSSDQHHHPTGTLSEKITVSLSFVPLVRYIGAQVAEIL